MTDNGRVDVPPSVKVGSVTRLLRRGEGKGEGFQKALANHMNPWHPPAFKEAGLRSVGRFEVVHMSINIVIQSGNVDAMVRRPVVLNTHESLSEEVDCALGGAAVEAKVQASGEANQSFEKRFVFFGCLVPDFFEHLVALEVFTAIEERNRSFELRRHRSTTIPITVSLGNIRRASRCR
jgi:hypothetical protein